MPESLGKEQEWSTSCFNYKCAWCQIKKTLTLYKIFLMISTFISSRSSLLMHSLKYGARGVSTSTNLYNSLHREGLVRKFPANPQ